MPNLYSTCRRADYSPTARYLLYNEDLEGGLTYLLKGTSLASYQGADAWNWDDRPGHASKYFMSCDTSPAPNKALVLVIINVSLWCLYRWPYKSEVVMTLEVASERDKEAKTYDYVYKGTAIEPDPVAPRELYNYCVGGSISNQYNSWKTWVVQRALEVNLEYFYLSVGFRHVGGGPPDNPKPVYPKTGTSRVIIDPMQTTVSIQGLYGFY